MAQLKSELDQANASIAKQGSHAAQLSTAQQQPIQCDIEHAQAHQALSEQQQNGVAGTNKWEQSHTDNSGPEGRTGPGAGPKQAVLEGRLDQGAGPNQAGTSEQGAGQDENEAPQSLLAGNPALLQWEEKKKMQKRLETLRAKLKVRILLRFKFHLGAF